MLKVSKFSKVMNFIIIFAVLLIYGAIIISIAKTNNNWPSVVIIIVALTMILYMIGVSHGMYKAAGRIIDFSELEPGQYEIHKIYYCKDEPNKPDLVAIIKFGSKRGGVVRNFPESAYTVLEENELIEVKTVKKVKIPAHNEVCVPPPKIPANI